MKSLSHRALLFVIGLMLVTAALPARAEAALPSRFYVKPTGQILAEPFLSHWSAQGGVDALGLPITAATKLDKDRVQLFERGGLRERSGGKVARMRVGLELTTPVSGGRDVAGRRVAPSPTSTGFRRLHARPSGDSVLFDEETGHAVKGRFLSFYDANGGQGVFGRPISEAHERGGRHVQWFQYGRLEWSDDNGSVSVAPTGYELAVHLGLDTGAAKRGRLPLLNPDRYHRFKGDGTVPEASGPFTPVRISVPAIGIDAAIEQVGIVDGVMGTPVDAWNVGWYNDFPRPGERTNVVMAGHRDWWGMGPVVFYNLEYLTPGERVYLIGEDGTGASYEITEVFAVEAGIDAGPLLGDQGVETLTLITCGGAFNGEEYLNRWIVRARRF